MANTPVGERFSGRFETILQRLTEHADMSDREAVAKRDGVTVIVSPNANPGRFAKLLHQPLNSQMTPIVTFKNSLPNFSIKLGGVEKFDEIIQKALAEQDPGIKKSRLDVIEYAALWANIAEREINYLLTQVTKSNPTSHDLDRPTVLDIIKRADEEAFRIMTVNKKYQISNEQIADAAELLSSVWEENDFLIEFIDPQLANS